MRPQLEVRVGLGAVVVVGCRMGSVGFGLGWDVVGWNHGIRLDWTG